MSGKGKGREKRGEERSGKRKKRIKGKKGKKETGKRRGRGNATAVHSCRHFGF